MSLAQSKLSWHTSMNDRFQFRPKRKSRLLWISLWNDADEAKIRNQIIAQVVNIISAKFDHHKVKQSKITEVLIMTISADSLNWSFWHILAPSLPFEVFDVLNYIFHFYVIICDHHIHFQQFLIFLLIFNFSQYSSECVRKEATNNSAGDWSI